MQFPDAGLGPALMRLRGGSLSKSATWPSKHVPLGLQSMCHLAFKAPQVARDCAPCTLRHLVSKAHGAVRIDTNKPQARFRTTS